MEEELKNPEYKDMKLVKIAYGSDEDQKSFTGAQKRFALLSPTPKMN